MTESDIQKVLDKIPNLGWHGIPLTDRHNKFVDKLLASCETCTKVCDWLVNKPRIVSLHNARSAASLRHMVSRQIGVPVTVGEFVVAAVHMGFRYIIRDRKHVYFAWSKKVK